MIKFVEFKKDNGDVIHVPISQITLSEEKSFGSTRYQISSTKGSKVVTPEVYDAVKDAMEITEENTLKLQIDLYD